jgi:DNA-binding transcriptional LysR family regulator
VEGWHGIEVRHLLALTAIEEERSFRGAAERLGYVQSAVSQQIARLEKLVGARLVERSKGHAQVALTDAGELLLDHATRVLGQVRAAKHDLEVAANGTSGVLRVGAFESVAARIMPRVLARLAVERPGLRVFTSDVPSDAELFSAVARGDLDAAFAELPLEDGPFEARRLLSDPCMLVVEREAPLALAETAPGLAEIAALPLVAQPGWRMSEVIDSHFEVGGLQAEYRYRSDTNAGIHAIVAAGLAAAIVPRLAVDERNQDTAAIEINVLPRRTLALYWHRERIPHPALDAFADAVAAVCDRLSSATRDRTPVPAPIPIRDDLTAEVAA